MHIWLQQSIFFFNLIVHISNFNFTLFENDLNFYLVGNTGLSITNLYGMARWWSFSRVLSRGFDADDYDDENYE